MKIISYNINGIRASSKKGLFDWLKKENADIICIQEVRANEELARKAFMNNSNQISLFENKLFLDKYYITYNCGKVPGYSGTVILSKKTPDKVIYGTNSEEDIEGRTITAIFHNLAVVNCYVPNGGKRLEYKFNFFDNLVKHLEILSKSYNVILCSDVNIAHTLLDVSNAKYAEKFTGFLPSERKLLDELFSEKFVDIVRFYFKDKYIYTWRSYGSQLSEKAVGIQYRFDYIITTPLLKNKVLSCEIQDLIYSDHLPVIATFDYKIF